MATERACPTCSRRTNDTLHCVFPSVDRITGVHGRLATPNDAMPLYAPAEGRRARARAIRAQNATR